MRAPPVTEFAPAKINLCLHVTGQRADGYHLLDSVVAFAGVGDRLEASLTLGEASLALGGPFGPELPAGGDNLVLRAARAVAPDLALAFTLEKNLPPASGIGGGSADAAAAVRAVLRLRGGAADPGVVQALGADVPVCLASRPARMRGIGERLDLLERFPPGWIVLANPRVEVPTPAVFRALSRKENPPLPDALPHWPDMAALAGWLALQRNDLEPPALAVAPVIGEVLMMLRAQAGQLLSRMSGSGATCFALFAEEAAARAAAAALTVARPGWWVAPAPLYPGN
ncbi:4-(cytidine 5'-diphospho)-2-C-methyl-D-erythritol kinase [Pseudogemmobacter humi]|uniref:4-diphosphocytidyl-2-C-methyl-D-erythritol kinase n=1 Tax=Pseudogemmobacter humi TaxID=2483812 RepID=A0A3P5X8E7_9RHOB|nr:4-(cytidine 5'-diphospho)-2-C-methyl-D-erythritol kinase [Pseudogemmobacter humi]VDC23654.1 4-diphosphocytidyl-2-C-methyl-D-erythritol kinase [Pseudogemmobacter humi]